MREVERGPRIDEAVRELDAPRVDARGIRGLIYERVVIVLINLNEGRQSNNK